MLWIGLLIGLFAGVCMTAFSSKCYAGILEGKADPKDRTPECINGKFFYIVPESEYLALVSWRNQRCGRLVRVVPIGKEGRCLCSNSDQCPLGRVLSMKRCTVDELEDAGILVDTHAEDQSRE